MAEGGSNDWRAEGLAGGVPRPPPPQRPPHGGGRGGGGGRGRPGGPPTSGFFGGGGGYAPAPPRGPSGPPPPPDAPREQGYVVTVKEHYGFIRCVDRDGQIFFHGSEVTPTQERQQQLGPDRHDLRAVVQQGEEVEFVVMEQDDRPGGKPLAMAVNVLAPGSIKTVEMSDERMKGKVARELRGGQRRRADAYGGRVVYTPVPPPVDGDEGAPPADSEAPRELELEFTGQDLADACPRLFVGDEVEFSVGKERRSGAERAMNITLVARRAPERPPGVPPSPTAEGAGDGGTATAAADEGEEPAREMGHVEKLKESYGFIKAAGRGGGRLFFHFSGLDGCREESLSEGCEVSYVTQPDRRTGKPTATGVRILEPGTIKAAEPSTWRSDATEGPSAGRELGVVAVLKDSYGFIRCCDREADLFFHFSALGGDKDSFPVGQDVEFSVVLDGRGNKPIAVNISLAAKGSAVFETVEETKRRGTCKERLTVSGYAKNRNDDKNAGQVSYTAAEGDDQPTTLAFFQGDLHDRKANPRPGDVVDFLVATDKRTGKRRATKVTLVLSAGTVTTVNASRGFLEEPAKAEGADPTKFFFHVSDVLECPDLKRSDEVEFIVSSNQRTGEPVARRVKRTKVGPEPPEEPEEPGPRPEGLSFSGSQFRMARGPDGSKGFAMGRGKALRALAGPLGATAPGSPAEKSLNVEATPFVPGS